LSNELLKICEEAMRLTEAYSPTEYPQPSLNGSNTNSSNKSSSSSSSSGGSSSSSGGGGGGGSGGGIHSNSGGGGGGGLPTNTILGGGGTATLSSTSSTSSNLSFILVKPSNKIHSCMRNDFLRIDNSLQEFPIKPVQFPLVTCHALHKVLQAGGSSFTSTGEHGAWRPRMTSIFFKILTSPSPISEPSIDVARKALT
jgi:hypothetical protein